MKKFFLIVLLSVCVVILGVLAACGNKTDNLQVVKVAFDNAPSEAGVILADKMGYFEKQGIKVEYIKFNSGADELSAILSNQVDVSRGIINAALFNASKQGFKMKVVADGGYNIPGKGFFEMALKKGLAAKVDEYKDLKGLRIAIASKGSINQLLAEKALEKGGLTEKDIEWVVVDSFPDMLTAVANGNADATMNIEPLITTGVDQSILDWWKDASEYAPGEEISALMYSPKFAENKELGKKFMVAYIQGVRKYNDAIVTGSIDREKVIDILTKTTFVDKADAFLKMNPPGLDPNGKVLVEGIKADQKWYMKKGLVKQEANIDEIVDTSYADYAVKVLGEYKAPK